ncbi:MAG TPA: radical SAM protein [Gemmatimonadaceae bacterium]|nr:radical SAM protein [Gemmatimonadaceae bacterium]
MLLGFALTQHCNLRCPHCIRDDVTTVQSLPYELVASILGQARALYGAVPVSFTGGEPLLHPRFGDLIALLAAEGHPYRFVSNGWHLARTLPHLDRYPPSAVRLSLSGATAETHDEERGRGSFHRLLLGVAILTSRSIPTHLSLVIDTRTVTQLRAAADLAESLGAHELHYILPQPVAASVMRDSDLPLEAWDGVRREIDALAAERRPYARIVLDYGFPEERETPCSSMSLASLYVDAWGRLGTCCQLSDYGFNTAEVVADLTAVPLADAVASFERRIGALARESAPRSDALTERFPCLRCARSSGKLEWLRDQARSPWAPMLAVSARETEPALG